MVMRWNGSSKIRKEFKEGSEKTQEGGRRRGGRACWRAWSPGAADSSALHTLVCIFVLPLMPMLALRAELQAK